MPAAAYWFVDANVTGVGHVLSAVHLSLTWIGNDGRRGRRKERHWLSPCPVTDHGEHDDVWISRVAATGASILTRDERIASRLLELDPVQMTRRLLQTCLYRTRNTVLSLVRMTAVVTPAKRRKSSLPPLS